MASVDVYHIPVQLVPLVWCTVSSQTATRVSSVHVTGMVRANHPVLLSGMRVTTVTDARLVIRVTQAEHVQGIRGTDRSCVFRALWMQNVNVR